MLSVSNETYARMSLGSGRRALRRLAQFGTRAALAAASPTMRPEWLACPCVRKHTQLEVCTAAVRCGPNSAGYR